MIGPPFLPPVRRLWSLLLPLGAQALSLWKVGSTCAPPSAGRGGLSDHSLENGAVAARINLSPLEKISSLAVNFFQIFRQIRLVLCTFFFKFWYLNLILDTRLPVLWTSPSVLCNAQDTPPGFWNELDSSCRRLISSIGKTKRTRPRWSVAISWILLVTKIWIFRTFFVQEVVWFFLYQEVARFFLSGEVAWFFWS